MDPTDFNFELPPELIAQQPLPERTASRLLELRPDSALNDRYFAELPELLRPGDLLVVNDTRVLPARLYGAKASGGRIEMLLERLLSSDEALVQLRSSHAPKPGSTLSFDGEVSATVLRRQDEFFVLRFARPVVEVLDQTGHVPRPPYIRRPDEGGARELVNASLEAPVAADNAFWQQSNVVVMGNHSFGVVRLRRADALCDEPSPSPRKPPQLGFGLSDDRSDCWEPVPSGLPASLSRPP